MPPIMPCLVMEKTQIVFLWIRGISRGDLREYMVEFAIESSLKGKPVAYIVVIGLG